MKFPARFLARHGFLKIHLFVLVMPKNISDSVFKNPESSADQEEKKNETSKRKTIIVWVFFSVELQCEATSALTLHTVIVYRDSHFFSEKKSYLV